jgi:hypothetical protein
MVCELQTAPELNNNILINTNICGCCDVIRSELDKLKTELKSCMEIIRVLHEEMQIK